MLQIWIEKETDRPITGNSRVISPPDKLENINSICHKCKIFIYRSTSRTYKTSNFFHILNKIHRKSIHDVNEQEIELLH